MSMSREERIAEVQAILKEKHKAATPKDKERIESNLDWADYESRREARTASRELGREM